jgi:hypothetical protein
LRVTDLVKHFPVKSGLLSRQTTYAVDGVSFEIAAGDDGSCRRIRMRQVDHRALIRGSSADLGGLVRRQECHGIVR